jgi:hypothetical protein
MQLRLGLVWLVLADLTTSGIAAAAGPPDAERLKIAAEEFDAGRRAFKVKDFENAAVHFENADRDAPSPEALQSAMRARKEAGQVARAATLGAWGVARHPNDKTFNDYAKPLLADADKTLHKVSIGCQPDCTVVVDNKVMPFPESANATVYLDPGPHAIVATWSNNRHRNADVAAVAGGNSKLVFNAASPDKSASPDTPSGSHDTNASGTEPQGDRGADDDKKGGLPPMAFYIGLATTAVLGGVTTWSGIDTLNNPGTAKIDECKAQAMAGVSCDWQALQQEGLAHQTRTNVLLGVTSVVAVTTGVIALFFTNWGGDTPQAEKKDARIMPVVGVSNGVTIGAVGRF